MQVKDVRYIYALGKARGLDIRQLDIRQSNLPIVKLYSLETYIDPLNEKLKRLSRAPFQC